MVLSRELPVNTNDESNKRPEENAPEVAKPAPPVLKSEDLLQGGHEVIILHHGETYRLLETRKGKLLLVK